MYKKLIFPHTNKLYMHEPESVLENETYKILWGFEIPMEHPILAGRPNLMLIYMKKELVI